MIRVDVTRKSFGTTEVLHGVRFDIQRGETLALLGPSGIGKSTLLRLVAGISKDFEGHIECPDKLAIVFQEPTLLDWRSTLDNILLVHPGLSRDAALAILDKVGLADKTDMYPRQLSLGQQRRLSLARAFAGQPDALIMDEPFVSLDAEMADDMLTLTERLIEETRPATLFVTHSRAEANRLAGRVLTLGGKPATVIADEPAGT
ncbi:MAG: ABC transporter ATP-binding protein [Rhodobacter sp.]|nr:ABC transporter ATP-binding protein [Rhodobacter sp.]